MSETTFLMAPSLPGADHRLRSFTAAGHEVGGAGHNALGAWLLLAHDGRVGSGTFHQQIGDDVLPVDVTLGERVRVTMDQSAPVFGRELGRRAELAAALGLDAPDGAHAYARFFNPTMGIVEDSATGTAAGPLAAALTRAGDVPVGVPVLIDQGHAAGRPSRLRIDVDGDRVRISGSGLVVGDGRLAV